MHSEERKRGRPTASERAARDARVLNEATSAFVERGFHGSSLDEIARCAGVTKRTIYEHFGDKTALLRAVVSRVHDYATADVRTLEDACEAVVAAVFADNAIGVHRAVISVAGKDPDVARAFYGAGPEVARRWLATFLDDDLRRADQLFTLLLGDAHRRRLLGIDATPGRVEVTAHVREVLELFPHATSKP